ncbi:hypothetical protein [Anaeromyxobacter paludicola]|uniref:Helix-turn-helix domain-containing protein n=1 Tax=Anaeromyxobacter paludicola TaxID=2918171 RepID=A0ABN6N1A1_9BACT|nr:hypothetical protein [Anaeromyxobacter paludicola]BDG06995.1 hypothetical protein AMPC_01080 [Anaeromyxobacter paludicola]
MERFRRSLRGGTAVSDAQALSAVIEAMVDRIVAVKIEAVLAARGAASQLVAAQAGRWMTPPRAAKATGVPVKTIRELIASGRLQPRLKNRAAAPKQPKYLVNVDEVAAAAALPRLPRSSEPRAVEAPAIDLAERARRIRAKVSGR